MTIREFDNVLWHSGMRVEILSGVFTGKVFDVVSPDFDQNLIGVDAYGNGELTYFRCENCKLV